MIIRRHITSNFTVIPNEAILDTRLSISARWLLAYLLSRPNDWQVQVGDIQKKGGIGREKSYRLIKELIAVGWVRKDFSRGEGGQWGGIEYVVMDQPGVEETSVSPFAEKPYTVKPLTENHHLTKDLKKPSTEKITSTEKNISPDPEFEEFWAAYPKRPANPKSAAKKKYLILRKQKVSHETLVNAARKYAELRKGEDPKFTAMAVTWLNQWRFEDDYSLDGGADSAAKLVSDAEVNTLAPLFPGQIGDREAVKRLMAEEFAKGTTLDALCEAARKYRLYCKGPPYEDRRIAPAPMDKWLRFKWREMEAYEFCSVGPDRIKTVRYKKVPA